jgi:nitroreductase
MHALDAIAARRSIRRFTDRPVPRERIDRILIAATQAPSGKNRQPWRFIVLTGPARIRLADLVDHSCGLIRAQGGDVGSAPSSARIIRSAPVVVVVFETKLPSEWMEFEQGARLVDTQSIGAAIENMCLAATDLGLGSLWIADVLYAETEITDWLAKDGERLISAVALGEADEAPAARPRRPVADVSEWIANAP